VNKTIINARPSLYGSAEDPKLRNRVRNKIDYWRTKGAPGFLRVAKSFGIPSVSSQSPALFVVEQVGSTPHQVTPRQVASTPRQIGTSTPHQVTPHQVTSTSHRSSARSSVHPRNLEANGQFASMSSPSPSLARYTGKCTVMLFAMAVCVILSLNSFQLSLGVYDADVNDPLKYAPLVIIQIEKMHLDGKWLTLIQIELDDQDIRDVIDNQYQLKIVSTHPNWLELTMPVCGYSRRNAAAAAEVTAEQKLCLVHDERVQEATDVARNAIRSTARKKYLIRFEDFVMLSNLHFSPDSVDGEVEQVDMPVESSCDFSSLKTYEITQTKVIWKLTTIEDKDYVVEAPAVKLTQHEKMMARMAARFAGTSMN
jgi:hypothetical protein